jgi:hypothetical protein
MGSLTDRSKCTLESLRGVFNPSFEDDDKQYRYIAATGSSQNGQTPEESVCGTRHRAEESIVRTAKRSAAPRADPSSCSGSETSEASDSEAENSDGGKKRKRRHHVAASHHAPRCFLCDYCTSQEVRFVTTFIADNIANMDMGLMAEQIRKYIFEKRPEYSTGHHGLEVVTIRKHIRQHMLSPTVRIADMMRHLMKLCDTLRGNLEKVDPDTGESTADRSNIDTYLKVVTKVLDMYKMSETNKMLFSSTEK